MAKVKGQGATEYLVILAVIIIIALVIVSIMGWFPGIALGVTEQQSKAYWRSTAPLAIVDWKFTEDANEAALSIQNMTTEAIEIREITINGIPWDVYDVNLGAGDINRVVRGAEGKACLPDSTYQYNIEISYQTVGGIPAKTQKGLKPLIGKCG